MYEAEANHALSLDSAAATLLANRKKKRLEDGTIRGYGELHCGEKRGAFRRMAPTPFCWCTKTLERRWVLFFLVTMGGHMSIRLCRSADRLL
jgi:hypothetical protein